MTQTPQQQGQPHQPGAPVSDAPGPTSVDPTLTPADLVKRAGTWHVSIQGIAVPGSPAASKAAGTTLLAKEAITRGEAIFVNVREEVHRSHLVVSPNGEVRRVAAPPPGSLREDYSLPPLLAASQAIADSTREWVEETLLVPPSNPSKQSATRLRSRLAALLRRGR